MTKTSNTYMNKFVRYIRRTYRNKLYAILMLAIGYAAMVISNDATLLVLMVILAAPLFLAKNNWIN